MTHDAREASVQDGEPVDLFTFVLSGRTYRLTDAEEDFMLGGNAWHATAGISRGPLLLQKVGQPRTLEVSIARNHPAAAIIRSNGIPPRTATVLVQTWHRGEAAGEVRELWSGSISHAQLRDGYLVMRVISFADAALDADLPHAVVDGLCRFMLYGPGCEVDRDYPTYANHPFMSIATVTSQTADVLIVPPLVDQFGNPRPLGWADFGEVRRIVDGERRSVLKHELADLSGNIALTLDVPFAYLVAGDDLEIYKGCNHTITMCHDDFANDRRHGGDPDSPDNNPLNLQGDEI